MPNPAVRHADSQDPDPHGGGASHAVVLLLTVLTLTLTALWGAAFVEIRKDRNAARLNAAAELSNLALAFASDVGATLQAADQAIRFVRREVTRDASSFQLARAVEQGNLLDQRFRQVAVIDAAGMLADSSLPFRPVDLSDRPHFRAHRESPRDVILVSTPVLGRVSGQITLQVTRRIDRVDGSFGGVVVVSLDAGVLTSFYRDVDLGESGLISLMGVDGVARVQRSGPAGRPLEAQDISRVLELAKQSPSGTFWTASRDGREPDLVAFRTLGNLGLISVAGRAESEVFAQARQLRTRYIGASAVFSVAVVLLCVSLLKGMRDQAHLVGQLRIAAAKAKRASEKKSTFLASVSHDIRTPLNGILGYAELIQDSTREDESREYAQVVLESGRHLHNLVNTILDLARIEAGQMTLVWSETGLTPLMEEACAMHRVTARNRGLFVDLDVATECPAMIRTDRTRLLQVLSNLIHNAVKFTTRGGISVRVRMAGGAVRIEVHDTGPGIPAEQIPLLFSRFQAVDAHFNHPGQGSGLGLPLARELTELLGGSLEVESEVGRGTTVAVNLPMSGGSSENSG